MANKGLKSTSPLTLANVPHDDKPTPGVAWADLMKVGLMPLSIPASIGEGEFVTYQSKAGKLLTCKVVTIVGEASDGKSQFVLAQLPPKEERARTTPEQRQQAKVQEKVDMAAMIAQAVAAALKQQQQ